MPALRDILTDSKAQRIAIATLAVALGVVTTTALTGDDTPTERDTKLEAIGEALRGSGERPTRAATARSLDTSALHTQIRKLRDAEPALVDLGGQLVAPGASTTAGVTLPAGTTLASVADCPGAAHASGLVCQLDPGSWTIGAPTCEEHDEQTWCEVAAVNTGTEAQRLLVVMQRAASAGDAGVRDGGKER